MYLRFQYRSGEQNKLQKGSEQIILERCHFLIYSRAKQPSNPELMPAMPSTCSSDTHTLLLVTSSATHYSDGDRVAIVTGSVHTLLVEYRSARDISHVIHPWTKGLTRSSQSVSQSAMYPIRKQLENVLNSPFGESWRDGYLQMTRAWYL